MITLYLITLIVGGGLLMLSIFGGGEHDADHDFDGDIDGDFGGGMDADMDMDGDVDGFDTGGYDAWLPIGSLRFWTFFAAFFGLVGTVLVAMGAMSKTMTLAPAIGVGYLSGIVATKVLRALTKQRVGKVVGSSDLVGVTGTLMLPASKSEPGKIRFKLGGRILEEIAYTDEGSMEQGAHVLIIAKHEEDGVLVAPAPLLGEGKESL